MSIPVTVERRRYRISIMMETKESAQRTAYISRALQGTQLPTLIAVFEHVRYSTNETRPNYQ